MRARSRRDRWHEERLITSYEMVWVVLWFQHRAKLWNERAKSSPQFAAYAYRQASNWEKLKEVALIRFRKANPKIVEVLGYTDIEVTEPVIYLNTII